MRDGSTPFVAGGVGCRRDAGEPGIGPALLPCGVGGWSVVRIFGCGLALTGCVLGEYAPVGECLGEGVGVHVVDDGK